LDELLSSTKAAPIVRRRIGFKKTIDEAPRPSTESDGESDWSDLDDDVVSKEDARLLRSWIEADVEIADGDHKACTT